jgi:oxygen-independent coproporphyrinogen-3 oxidase
VTEISSEAAMEEAFFLGLRLNRGVDLTSMAAEFGEPSAAAVKEVVDELVEYALLERGDHHVRLTAQGRLLSNEVFEKFLGIAAVRSSRS